MNIPGIDESGRDKIEIDGPGKRLRSIREKQQLDITKIAARLHLGVAQLQALEEDAYDRLPASVFVRGYLCNYARILGESEEEMLAAYAAINPDQGEPAKLIGKPPSTDTKISSDYGVVRLTTWVIVLLMVGAVALWSHGYLQEAGRQIADKIESVSPTISAVTEGGGEEQPQALLEPFLKPAEAPPEKAADEPVVTEEAADQATEDAGSQAASDPEPLPQQQVEAETRPVAEVSTGSIVFEFTGTSWIQVKDAQGKVRLKGELNAGDRRRLRGEAPFSVTVGNVPAVNLMVDGKPFDFGPYTRHSVAKFTLDQGAAR
jgi:cytoskeleton protein RodZ